MKKQIFTAVLAVVAMVFFFLPMASLAQQATTSLTGVVTDPSGGVLPGASVTLTRPATGQTLTTTTNPRGQYTVLPTRAWHVECNHQRQRFCRPDQGRDPSGQQACHHPIQNVGASACANGERLGGN